MEQISVTINKFPEHNEEIYEAWKSCWTEVQENEFVATGVKYIWSYQQSDDEVYYVGITYGHQKKAEKHSLQKEGQINSLLQCLNYLKKKLV